MHVLHLHIISLLVSRASLCIGDRSHDFQKYLCKCKVNGLQYSPVNRSLLLPGRITAILIPILIHFKNSSESAELCCHYVWLQQKAQKRKEHNKNASKAKASKVAVLPVCVCAFPFKTSQRLVCQSFQNRQVKARMH
jgi:hypothetical protein